MTSNMRIEQERQWCCCNQSVIQDEKLQEQTALKNTKTSNIQHHQNKASTTINSSRYSFKKKYSFRFQLQRYQSPIHQGNYTQAVGPQQVHSIDLTFSKSTPKLTPKSPIHINYQRQTLSSPVKSSRVNLNQARQPRITFIISEPTQRKMNLSPPVKISQISTKICNKIKTNEEQTEYSSKHSQVLAKNCNQYIEVPVFSFKNSLDQPQKHVLFKEEISQKSRSFVDIPSCQQVSARQETDNSLINELFQNARTMKTIITSTELKSRQPSLGYNFIRDISQVGLKNSGNTAQFPSVDQLNNSIYNSPTSKLSQFEESPLKCQNIEKRSLSPDLQSNIFYSEQTFLKKKSPKISVLNIQDRENSEDEELRDQIDHKMFKQHSAYVSSKHSPSLSINQSLKNLEDKRITPNVSAQHSRQTSGQILLFKQNLQQFKRTNTVESLNSSVSQHSFLDMKFVQKMRSRRGVSKLV